MSVKPKMPDLEGLRIRLASTVAARVRDLEGLSEPRHNTLSPQEIDSLQKTLEQLGFLQGALGAVTQLITNLEGKRAA